MLAQVNYLLLSVFNRRHALTFWCVEPIIYILKENSIYKSITFYGSCIYSLAQEWMPFRTILNHHLHSLLHMQKYCLLFIHQRAKQSLLQQLGYQQSQIRIIPQVQCHTYVLLIRIELVSIKQLLPNNYVKQLACLPLHHMTQYEHRHLQEQMLTIQECLNFKI